jgi:hypothetical protein
MNGGVRAQCVSVSGNKRRQRQNSSMMRWSMVRCKHTATTKQHNAGSVDEREGGLVTALDQKTGDHSNEMLHFQNRLEDEEDKEYARDHFFSDRNLRLDKDGF